jgi:hypothetical protein
VIARRLQFESAALRLQLRTLGRNANVPLYSNAEKVIHEHLELVRIGQRPRRVTIGELSKSQLDSLNEQRMKAGFDPLNGLVFFRGKHIYDRRIVDDCYTVEDVIDQIKSAFSEASTTHFSPKMSSLRNPVPRADRYGNQVKDEVALECFANHPRAELFSVIPKGDKKKPSRPEKTEGLPKEASAEKLATNPPG